MMQASAASATVCLKDGTFYSGIVRAKFPGAQYMDYPTQDECLDALKSEECILYTSNKLQLCHRAANNITLQVMPESFNTQYIVWGIKDNMPNIRFFEKWIYDSITNSAPPWTSSTSSTFRRSCAPLVRLVTSVNCPAIPITERWTIEAYVSVLRPSTRATTARLRSRKSSTSSRNPSRSCPGSCWQSLPHRCSCCRLPALLEVKDRAGPYEPSLLPLLDSDRLLGQFVDYHCHDAKG
jgi:hypothetical protein